MIFDRFFVISLKKSKNELFFLTREYRVLMLRSSLIDGQILGKSSAFVRTKMFSADFFIMRGEKVAIPVKITSYSLEALHADASRLAHAIGPNLIEIRKFGDIFVQKQRFHVPKHRKLRVRAPRWIRLESPTATDMP